MRIQKRSKRSQRGVAIMEFTFSLVFLIPLLIGILVFGFKLIRSLEMAQVTRDLAAMYLRGVDFRGAGAIQTAQTLAESFRMTSTGSSVVILSKVKLVVASDCAAANAVAPVVAGTDCANKNQLVFMEQLKVGNPSAGTSRFGTPPVVAAGCTPIAAGVPCSYTVTVKDQGRTSGARATNFPMVLNAGEYAYVAEMVNLTPDLNVPGISGGPQVYARAIF